MTSGAATRSVSAVIIDSDSSVAAAIQDLLAGREVSTIHHVDHDGGLRAVREHRPDLVFVELTASNSLALEAVQQIRTEFLQTAILVSSAEKTPELILRSMRAGAQEFLSRPVSAQELLEALDRLTGRLHLSTQGGPKGGRILAVFSTKGGGGVSSLATNLAVVLSRKGNRVALADLDVQSGDLELMLNLKPTSTISDAVSGGPIQEDRIRSCMTAHQSGICLLGAPRRIEDAEKIAEVDLVEIFGVMRAMFDHVIVDAGHTLDDRTLGVLELANLIIVPVLLNVPAVRAVGRALELFQKLGFPGEKSLLVVNRDQKRTKISVSDVEQTLGRRVFCTLPNDFRDMMRSIDVGVPVVLEAPRSSIARSFDVLGDKIIDLGISAGSEPRKPGFPARKRLPLAIR